MDLGNRKVQVTTENEKLPSIDIDFESLKKTSEYVAANIRFNKEHNNINENQIFNEGLTLSFLKGPVSGDGTFNRSFEVEPKHIEYFKEFIEKNFKNHDVQLVDKQKLMNNNFHENHEKADIQKRIQDNNFYFKRFPNAEDDIVMASIADYIVNDNLKIIHILEASDKLSKANVYEINKVTGPVSKSPFEFCFQYHETYGKYPDMKLMTNFLYRDKDGNEKYAQVDENGENLVEGELVEGDEGFELDKTVNFKISEIYENTDDRYENYWYRPYYQIEELRSYQDPDTGEYIIYPQKVYVNFDKTRYVSLKSTYGIGYRFLTYNKIENKIIPKDRSDYLIKDKDGEYIDEDQMNRDLIQYDEFMNKNVPGSNPNNNIDYLSDEYYHSDGLRINF